MAKKSELTFIESARRTQIIDATLEIIATQGFTRTSFSEIAKKVGITKGLITYHFDGKADLISSVIHTIIDKLAAHLKENLAGVDSAKDKLCKYISASLDYIENNRLHFVSMVDLWGSFNTSEEKRQFNKTFYGACISQLDEVIILGQQTGEFGDFKSELMPHIIQAALDGLMVQWVCNPDVFQLTDCTDELLETFLKRVLK